MWRINLARKAIAGAQRALDAGDRALSGRRLAFARAMLRGEDVDDMAAGEQDGRVVDERSALAARVEVR